MSTSGPDLRRQLALRARELHAIEQQVAVTMETLATTHRDAVAHYRALADEAAAVAERELHLAERYESTDG